MKAVIGVTTDHAVQYHKDLALLMLERGWDVTFVSTGGAALDSLGELSDADGLNTVVLPMVRNPSPVADLKGLRDWVALLRTVRPDVVIAGTPKAGLLGIMASTLTRVPTRVYWLHGLRLETATGPLRRVLFALEWLTVRLSTRTVAVSHSLKARVEQLRIARPERVTVIGAGSTQGVDTARFAPAADQSARDEAVAAWDLDPAKPVIGFVGRLTTDKGVRELAEALTQLRERGLDFQALLIGPVEDEDGEESLKSLDRAGVEYQAPGHVSDTAAVYQAMDIFCLPSYREGLPNVVLEAFSAGLPVVASNVTGNSDLVEPGVNGVLVEPRDADGLATALGSLLEDTSARQDFAAAARETAVQSFAVDKVVEEQLEFLEALHGKRKAAK